MDIRSEDAIKIGKLTIRLAQGRNIKLFVFRNDRSDLPHLTISWRNVSGEIDIHLKKRTQGGQEYHEPITTISESDFGKVCESFQLALLKVITINIDSLVKIRPGWLGRRGYVILHLPDDIQKQLIQKLAPKQKRHGKWAFILNEDLLKDPSQLQELTSNCYHPAVLHELAAIGCEGPVFAECVRRKRKGHLMLLQLIAGPNGRRYWVRTNDLVSKMMKLSGEFIPSSFRQLLPGDAWAKIHNELHLDEIGIDL